MKSRARTMTRVAAVAGATLFAMSCSDDPTTPPEGAPRLAPFYGVSAPGLATNRYFVVFKKGTPNVPSLANDLVTRFGGSISYVYQHALQGFSGALPPPAVDAIRLSPAVEYVQQVELGKFRLHDHTKQSNATWGIDRVDQRSLPLSGNYEYSGTGSGVRVYIIDTGIQTTHSGFGGRASVFLDPRPQDGLNGQDCNGHGTHVAGTIGSTTYGVAKGTTLLAVHVNLACSDTIDAEAAITAIDSITGTSQRPAIVNLSWGGPPDTTLDRAINNSINAGVVYVVSAGNNGGDACALSPSRIPNAVTVAASDNADRRATDWFWASNFGSCVDLFAPGKNITSLWRNGGTNTISGTSMAAPHVSGVAALYLQRVPTAMPAQVWSAISSRTTQGVLTNIGTGSPNLLLYAHFNDITVSGPSTCSAGSTYTATAAASGVGSAFTYRWQRAEPSGFGGGVVWVNVGSGATYSQACQSSTGTHGFLLRVTATDEFGFHVTAYKAVDVV